MALVLQDPNYKPPTGYAIIGNPITGSAFAVYDAIEKCKQSGWFRRLAQYGISRLDYRGWAEAPFVLGGTIHIILPTTLTLPGFPNSWYAYHEEDQLSYCYAIMPTTQDLQGGLTVAATHEVVEALLDSPPGSGWITGNEEAADVCETDSDNVKLGPYLISSYWLNDANRCLIQGDL